MSSTRLSLRAPDAVAATRLEGHASVYFWSFAAFLILAPLYKGGNRPLPLLLLELAAIGFLFVVLAIRRTPLPHSRTLMAAIGILLLYPLIQLLPLPDAWWRDLPAHAEYANAIDRFAAGLIDHVAGVDRSLSLMPLATETGWLALLPPLACLLGIQLLAPSAIVRLLVVITVFAALESLLGLLQVGSTSQSIIYRPIDDVSRRAMGTFVNPDHLAAFLGMTLPVIIGLFASAAYRDGPVSTDDPERPVRFDSDAFSQRGLLYASAVLIMLCLVFTWSRAGIATALMGLSVAAILLPHTGGSKRSKLLVPGLVIAVVILAAIIGITPLLERVGPKQLGEDASTRLLMSQETFDAGLAFWPFGSGLSTLEYVFPRFQTGLLPFLIDYAHNDYVQAFMELGLGAVLAVSLLIIAYVTRMFTLLRRGVRQQFTILRLAAGVALLPLIFHSLFDFALHMPAIAMWFATLAGILFHPGMPVHRANLMSEPNRAKPAALAGQEHPQIERTSSDDPIENPLA